MENKTANTTENKERFLKICREEINRPGLENLIEWLEKSDFFQAPASSKFHGNYVGGLCEHSLNVYDCLVDYLNRPRVKETYGMEYSDESIAIVSLLHDVCKVNCYKKGTRNVKDANGVWQTVPTYEYDDKLPYGHGEKSVYVIGGFMRLSREEAFAIRYHMGFSSKEEARDVSAAFSMFPLAFALSVADQEATFLIEQ